MEVVIRRADENAESLPCSQTIGLLWNDKDRVESCHSLAFRSVVQPKTNIGGSEITELWAIANPKQEQYIFVKSAIM